MKVRINYGIIMFVLLLILEYKFFYLIELPGTLGATSNSVMVFIFSFLLFLLSFTNKRKKMNSDIKRYVFTVMIVQAAEFVYTIYRYPEEPWLNAIKMILPMVTLLSCFYINDLARNKYKQFIGILVFFSTMGALLLLSQAVLYNTSGISLLHVYGFNYGRDIDFRDFRVRILGSSLIDYTAYLSVGLLFSQYKVIQKKYLIINVISVLLYNIFTSQTRATLLMFMIEVFVFMVFSKNSNYITKLITAVLGFGVVIWVCSYIHLMLNAVSTDYSIYHRIDAIEYYLECFMKSPVFGNGLLTTEPTNQSLYYIVHGYQGFSYVDVGFIGDLGLFGSMALMMYFRYFKTLYIMRTTSYQNTLLISITVASIFSMISLSLFNAGRVLVMAIYLIVAEASRDFLLEKCGT